VTINGQSTDSAALLAQFPTTDRSSTLFVVDPKGNLMMRYDAHANPRGLHDDLQKLLALSHIG
jgi:cytochrome oxidase Cu insertion factor (SCO1/SenC/PrrC family)